MRLFDTSPQSWDAVVIGQFEGGTYDLAQPEITKSFKKAQKMALTRLRVEMKELQEQIAMVERMTEETCPAIENPYA